MKEITTEQLKLELHHEESMLESGRLRFVKENSKAETGGRFSSTLAGSRILDRNIAKVESLIKNWKQDVKEGKPTHGVKAYRTLETIDSAKLALITSKTILNNLMKPIRFSTLACSIGRAVEHEEKFSGFRAENPHYVDSVVKAYNKRASSSHFRTRSLNYLAEQKGYAWEAWGEDVHAHVGFALFQMFNNATGLVSVVTQYSGKRTIDMVQAQPQVIEWIRDFNATQESINPRFLPTLVPPKPWTSPVDGGYYHPLLQRPLVKGWVRKRQRHLLAESEMPMVIEALNHVQETEWCINTKLLAVMTTCWENSLADKALPNRDDLEILPCPVDKDVKVDQMNTQQKLAFEVWRAKAREIRNTNAESRGKRIQLELTLNLAKSYREKSIYFPHSLDYRGRIYPIPGMLNPQGSDSVKALLMFKQGGIIENQTAANWLAVHGANCFGVDKVSYEERLAWVRQNEQAILAIAEEPLDNTMWVEADSPWQFLAWCQEWRAFKQQGMGFVTHIPVGLDGSCNGLQHFSAMLRDEAGAEAVNLIPNEKPADIYQRVCDGVKADLLAMLPTGRGKRSEEAVFAKKFLEWDKTTRKLTKRPVMIVPYGGTTRATFKYTLEYLNEHKDAPFKDNYKAAQFVSKVIWDNVAKETQSAQQVMKWLQGIARNMSKEDSTIEWTTPSGFVVSMANLTTYDKFLEVKLFDRRYQVKLKEYAQTIDSNQQVSGISPNFVHALDASALVFYVMRAKAQGIPNLALIHDSYGTTADQTELASQLLREAFVQLYAEHDVLAEFKSQMPVGMAKEEPPSQGGFDINQVLSADYFFA